MQHYKTFMHKRARTDLFMDVCTPDSFDQLFSFANEKRNDLSDGSFDAL